ncbi:PP2C family protein-serine/threonine phosphatase [Pseudomonas sp. KNUC1026]|uniref:PP2C family protein-serine/threonine phosphatase n=1 Tax=Pseudomonas sp. KNUC1026 TaxID=2893890 RepID=UPI001F2AF003|nr:serine/threonine protein phosphatase [Pseudomonas sp. KNUC1026]UFH49920.1 serine/threonine protein phosphatase [Pseudomonas sp. KNUC1026]
MIQYTIRTVQGSDRTENRDCAMAQYDGVRGVFVVADGTSKPGSELLAPAFVDHIVNGYRTQIDRGALDSNHEQVESVLRCVLHNAHSSLFSERATGSASYLIAVVSGGLLTIAYEGDCSAGVAAPNNPIDWLTPPHCLANWKRDRGHRQLASDVTRHIITRSFKARRTPDPDFIKRVAIQGDTLVFATDGFWADLSDRHQAQMLDPETPDPTHIDDDVTWIVVQI